MDYTSQAIQHRVAAIKLVNQQFDNPSKNPVDADALFATVLCLIAQSSLMLDSMAEYMTMVRGGNLVATTIVPDYDKSLFRAFTPEGHMETLATMVQELPKDLEVIDGFRMSILALETLCQQPHELMYCASMVRSITALRTSSLVGKGEPTSHCMHSLTASSVARICPSVHDAQSLQQRRVHITH